MIDIARHSVSVSLCHTGISDKLQCGCITGKYADLQIYIYFYTQKQRDTEARHSRTRREYIYNGSLREVPNQVDIFPCSSL